MPWAFLAVLVAISAITASAVVWGTDADGTKGFVSTAADQQSLIAFAGNAMIIAGLFGAIAVAREYGYLTVIPTFLASPRRYRAVLPQLIAVAIGGAVVGFVGAALTVVGVAATLPTTDFGFMVSAAEVTRVLAAACFTGASGAILGAGIGMVVRNTGGAVVGAVLALIIAPPLIVQLINDASSWMPSALSVALSGVELEAAGVESQVSAAEAALALAAWAIVPAVIGLLSVQRRDVV
jgi:ABC-2 type transport system permease protein